MVDHAIGTWTFEWQSAGVVSIRPPKGYRLPLRVGIVDAPRTAEVGEPVALEIALSRPAEVKTVTESRDGTGGSQAEVKDAGSRRVTWQAPKEPGKYDVKVRAASGGLVRNSKEVQIVVSESRSDETSSGGEERAEGAPVPDTEDASAVVPAIVLGIVLVMAVVVVVRAVSIKR